MAKVLLLAAGAAVAQSSALTRYYVLGNTGNNSAVTAEGLTVEVTHRTAGTLSNLYVRVSANTLNGDTTVRTRKNRANGNQSVTIGSSTTGEFEDTTNTDTVAAADELNYQAVTLGSSGSISFRAFSNLFAATTDTVTRFVSNNSTALARNSTFYRGLSDSTSGGSATDETFGEFKVGRAGTLKNFFVSVSANNNSSNGTARTRVAGANGNCVVTITASTTGIFEDTTNSDSISAGQKVSFQIVTGVGSGAQTTNPVLIAIDYASTDASTALVCGKLGGVANNITSYYAAAGVIASTTTETEARHDVNFAGTASKLYCRISANATTAASTVDLRVNGASSALTISVGSGATGDFEDATNTVALIATDEINYRFVPGTANSVTFRVIGMSVVNTESAGATGRLTATQGNLVYDEKTGRLVATQGDLVFDAKTGRLVATQGDLVFDAKTGRLTAVQGDLVYDAKTGRLVATQGDLVFDPKTARITAVQGDIVYITDEATGRITAIQGDLIYNAKTGRLTALQGDIVYDVKTGRLVALQADLTFDLKTGRLAAVQADLVYDAKTGRITAAQADLVFDAKTGRVTATQADIVYTVIGGPVARLTAVQGNIVYDELAIQRRIRGMKLPYPLVKSPVVPQVRRPGRFSGER